MLAQTPPAPAHAARRGRMHAKCAAAASHVRTHAAPPPAPPPARLSPRIAALARGAPRRSCCAPTRAAFDAAAASAPAAAPSPAAAAPAAAPAWHTTSVLKEWASVCASIAAGQTTLLLRKGGIQEKGFKVASARFALYPTSFHNAEALLQPRAAPHAAAPGATPGADAALAVLAECTGAWQTDDPAVLSALSAFHPWTDGLLETRFKWRPSQAITVVELRALRLATPHALRGAPEHGGCTSWISLAADAAVSAAGATYALDDATWQARQAATRAALASLKNVTPLPLPEE